MEETFLYTDRDLMYPLIEIQQKGNDYITVMDPANDRKLSTAAIYSRLLGEITHMQPTLN